MQTLWEAFAVVAAEEPRLSCLVVPPAEGRAYDPDGIEWSYGEVAERVQALIDRYAAKGWGCGHRVALLLENRPAFMLHFLALNALGAWVIPINPDYKDDDLSYLFRHSEPDLVVSLAARVADITAAAPEVHRQVVDSERFSSALARASRPAHGKKPDRASEAILLYTSGTTGFPKGCLIGNDYLFYAGERYIRAGGLMQVRPRAERLYNPLPLFYANSLSISNPAMILSRNAMIFPDRFHPRRWWRDLVSTRATIIHYLGIIPPVLLSLDRVAEERAHTVRFGIGAGIDPAQHAAFEARFGFPMIEVWGMSEVGIATAAHAEPRRIDTRTIGRPLEEIELAILDDEDRPASTGEAGELSLRRRAENPRAGLFRGYFKEVEATETAWRGGWFHTGDIARQDADGTYHFIDRKKHMIRRSGQNIAAAEVEACLRRHPAVREVAAVAAPDELREEEVLACIVLRDGYRPSVATATEIADFARDRLAYFKVPGWVLFLDSLPTTATQKLQKTRIFASGEDPRTRTDIFDLRDRKQRASARA